MPLNPPIRNHKEDEEETEDKERQRTQGPQVGKFEIEQMDGRNGVGFQYNYSSSLLLPRLLLEEDRNLCLFEGEKEDAELLVDDGFLSPFDDVNNHKNRKLTRYNQVGSSFPSSLPHSTITVSIN